MTVMHAYDAAIYAINNDYGNARNFRHNRKLFGCNKKEMRQKISKDLKTFYQIGTTNPRSVQYFEMHRQDALSKRTNLDYNYKFPTFKEKIKNKFETMLMWIRIKSIINSNSELKNLSKKYFQNLKNK